MHHTNEEKDNDKFCNFTYDKDEKNKLFIHLRTMKNIQRLSSVPLIQKYSLAEHCYYTGILFEEIAEEQGIGYTAEVIQWVYRHDVFESLTGDVLRPAKNHNEKVSELWDNIEMELSEDFDFLSKYTDSYAEKTFPKAAFKLWKACDLFELLIFCNEEYELGNKSKAIIRIIRTCCKYLLTFDIPRITDWVNTQGFV